MINAQSCMFTRFCLLPLIEGMPIICQCLQVQQCVSKTKESFSFLGNIFNCVTKCFLGARRPFSTLIISFCDESALGSIIPVTRCLIQRELLWADSCFRVNGWSGWKWLEVIIFTSRPQPPAWSSDTNIENAGNLFSLLTRASDEKSIRSCETTV